MMSKRARLVGSIFLSIKWVVLGVWFLSSIDAKRILYMSQLFFGCTRRDGRWNDCQHRLRQKREGWDDEQDCHQQKPLIPVDRQLMGVLLTGQHSCGILTHRVVLKSCWA